MESSNDVFAPRRQKPGPLGAAACEAPSSIATQAARSARGLGTPDGMCQKACVRVFEAEHRIKNHLQLLASYTRLAAARPGATPATLGAEIAARIDAIASVHQALQAAGAAGETRAAHFLTGLCRSFGDGRHEVLVDCGIDLTLSADQLAPVGMIVTEAVTNANKHAFPGGRSGAIAVSLERLPGNEMELRVGDDGRGLAGWRSTHSGGLKLISLLARQLDGAAQLQERPGGGAELVVSFAQARAPWSHV